MSKFNRIVLMLVAMSSCAVAAETFWTQWAFYPNTVVQYRTGREPFWDNGGKHAYRIQWYNPSDRRIAFDYRITNQNGAIILNWGRPYIDPRQYSDCPFYVYPGDTLSIGMRNPEGFSFFANVPAPKPKDTVNPTIANPTYVVKQMGVGEPKPNGRVGIVFSGAAGDNSRFSVFIKFNGKKSVALKKAGNSGSYDWRKAFVVRDRTPVVAEVWAQDKAGNRSQLLTYNFTPQVYVRPPLHPFMPPRGR